MTDKTNFDKARIEFLNGLCCLNKLGFDGPKVEIESDELTGDWLVMKYSSMEAGRIIDISYRCNWRGLAIFIFVISNDGKRISITDWLKFNYSNFPINFLADIDSMSEHEFIERFCHDFCKLCENELSRILSGVSWQDIPFDWMGYK